jgi:predicted nucleic acid-binding protein
MLIVSDTGPLRYLVEIAIIDTLPRLYGDVMTTPQVLAELGQEHFPPVVRTWAAKAPSWLRIESPAQVQFLDRLDEGEASALSLACERHADLLLIDEMDGRRVAKSEGLKMIGTLGILSEAGHAGYVDFHEAVDRLTTTTTFHHTASLIAHVKADFDREQVRRRP